MSLQFKYLEIDTSKGLKDKEVKIEGKGLIVLSTPPGCFLKINSKLADPIPAVTIEKLQGNIDKIFVTTPPDIINLKLVIVQDEIDIDANTNYDIVSSIGTYMATMILIGARRGNKLEIHVLDPDSSPITIQDPYVVGPYLLDNLIGFSILEGTGDNWTLVATAHHPGDATQELTSTVDLSGLTTGDKIELIAHTYVFHAQSGASQLKIAVDFLYIPIWSK